MSSKKLKIEAIVESYGKTWDFSDYENSDFEENMGRDMNLFCLYILVISC